MAINPKKLAGDYAASFVRDGMLVGLGTGSTAYWAIEKIGEMVGHSGLRIRAVSSSKKSEEQARSLKIPIVSFSDTDLIDITIDGADEVDPDKNLIKGGGGALLREKIVAFNSRKLIIIVDDSKLVKQLGRFPVPVETAIFGWERTKENLAGLGCQPNLRMSDIGPFITDNGNYIIDCSFRKIEDPELLQQKINLIPGVLENGLFIHLASMVIVGHQDGRVKQID
ncbi:MAG: ribose-5-phosphate isomerase RpiA [Chitinophagales bacterium]